jgi:serine palmitoyltransferase
MHNGDQPPAHDEEPIGHGGARLKNPSVTGARAHAIRMPSPLPSPMALSPAVPSRSSFIKRTSSSGSPSRDASALLHAVKQADALARESSRSPTPTATPALSMSSSVTRSNDGTVFQDDQSRHNGPVDDAYVTDEHDDGLGLPRVPPTSEQQSETRHTEFGHCWNDAYRLTATHPLGEPVVRHPELDPPYYILLSTYMSYMLLIVIGHVRDFFGKRAKSPEYRHLMAHDVSLHVPAQSRVRSS